jgi:hypothetical protein
MKKIILLLAVCSLAFSCKKESGAGKPKQILLTEIKVDGLIEIRAEYNSDNLISKLEGYKAELNDNTLQTYVIFQYTADGQIKEYTAFGMPGDIPVQKYVVTYDSAGKMVSNAFYELLGPTPNKAIQTTWYTYNNKGFVSKTVSKDKDGTPTNQTNYSYYDDGQLKERQGWRAEGGVLWLSSKYTFSIPTGFHPSGFEQIRVLNGSEFTAGMNSDAINYKFYDQSGAMNREYSDIMSARQYNADGSLKQQVVTRKYIKPEDDDDDDEDAEIKEYKYITQ